jgi:TetR/AcrR family transcriptional regulator
MQTRLSTEERQAGIVAAALELARESSPARITTADIAAAVGITQGAVFKHFPTKDAIWLAAMRWVRETLLNRLQDVADEAATPLDALAAVFRAHVEFVIAHPGVPRFIFHELQMPADSRAKLEVRSVLEGYRQLLLRLLARTVEVRQAREGLDLEAAATVFIGLLQGLVMQSMLSGRPLAMRRQAGPVFAIYASGLGVAA